MNTYRFLRYVFYNQAKEEPQLDPIPDFVMLIEDVIKIILKDLDFRDIFSALLVNREWCRAAVPFYWKAPFNFTRKRSMAALKTYEVYLEQGSNNDTTYELWTTP
ncbi:hypothetical protein Glove_168g275 [Diversispora epigaea]|uniref:F-box domain-containing protein n=1 Tax=Diversispora epigaea TaxID=1348612 RepID=A0A397IPZ1_9GLOM|nr:hypothetical protein Glove_168g275 [Diversispora epigaea]